MARRAALAASAWSALLGSPIAAQADSDPAPHVLDEHVVVAHRAPTVLRQSIAATTVLDRGTLDRLPGRTLADVLRHVPGLTFVARDGAGELPMAIARGFFGGGETDYVLLTVDGTPVNDLRTGTAEWTQIPVAAIERVEVLRGGASVAYGDAALGAVVNVVTRAQVPHRLTGELKAGSWGERALQVSLERPLGSDRLGLAATAAGTDGWRSRERASNLGLSARYGVRPGEPASGYARAGIQRLRNEDPGPLTPEQIAGDPRQPNPLFEADERRRDLLDLAGGGGLMLGAGRLTGDVRVQVARDHQTRTLPLTPDIGDTQFQEARSWALGGRIQYTLARGRSTIVAGLEAERGAYDSRYADPVDHTALRSRGEGVRTKLGQYAELQQQLSGRLRAVAGLRFDFIGHDGTGVETAAHFSQLSPRLGLNFAYSEHPSRPGNLYAAWTRSFKAPTAYQLYDPRLIPAGEPGAVLNLSNPGLRPQHAAGLELGVYQRLSLAEGGAFAELALSAYRLDVSDEIDFDLRTFKYGNIVQSRHDGVEGSLGATLLPWLSLRHALTMMRVTFRGGPEAGNRLKSIPGTVLASAVHLSFGKGVEGTVTHRFSGSVFLDDANRESLPGTHRVDASLSWPVGAVHLHLAGMNLGNSHAGTGGFLVFDPVRGSDVRMLYPGGGRYLRAGVTVLR